MAEYEAFPNPIIIGVRKDGSGSFMGLSLSYNLLQNTRMLLSASEKTQCTAFSVSADSPFIIAVLQMILRICLTADNWAPYKNTILIWLVEM